MSRVVWTDHASAMAQKRGIDRTIVEQAMLTPTAITLGYWGRRQYLLLYFDAEQNRDMLACAVVEESGGCQLIITAYKTSKLRKYLTGGTQ